MENTLNEVKAIIENLAGKIKVDSSSLPTLGVSKDFAHPHIEINKQGYHYVIAERGREQSRKTTKVFNDFIGCLKILHLS